MSSSGECECDHDLLSQQVECDINSQSFLVPDNSWIGFINKTQSTNMTGTGVIFHPNCPFGYCSSHNVSITSSTGDDQCEHHRSGLLCGKCQEGYSLTLGSGKCAKCSNVFLLLIIPIAVSGLLLVGVLFALNFRRGRSGATHQSYSVLAVAGPGPLTSHTVSWPWQVLDHSPAIQCPGRGRSWATHQPYSTCPG